MSVVISNLLLLLKPILLGLRSVKNKENPPENLAEIIRVSYSSCALVEIRHAGLDTGGQRLQTLSGWTMSPLAARPRGISVALTRCSAGLFPKAVPCPPVFPDFGFWHQCPSRQISGDFQHLEHQASQSLTNLEHEHTSFICESLPGNWAHKNHSQGIGLL